MLAELRDHKLGWIGVGRMGYPMAERLAKAGADVSVYNRTRAKAEPLTKSGIRLVERPADLDRDRPPAPAGDSGDVRVHGPKVTSVNRDRSMRKCPQPTQNISDRSKGFVEAGSGKSSLDVFGVEVPRVASQ